MLETNIFPVRKWMLWSCISFRDRLSSKQFSFTVRECASSRHGPGGTEEPFLEGTVLCFWQEILSQDGLAPVAAERATPPLLSFPYSLPLFFPFSFLYYVPSTILDLKSLEISKQCLRRPFTFLGFHLPESSFLCPAQVVCLQCLVRKSVLFFGLTEVLHSLPY